MIETFKGASSEGIQTISGVRILEAQDVAPVQDLAAENEARMQKKWGESYFHSRDFLHRCLDPSDCSYLLVGAFSTQSELMSMMGLYFWPELPFATIDFMMTSRKFGLFNPLRNGLNDCLIQVVRCAEERGVHSFYLLRPAATMRAVIRKWSRSESAILQRYCSFTEALIRAHSRPAHSFHWDLMEKRLWPIDLEVRRVELKREFRQNLNTEV